MPTACPVARSHDKIADQDMTMGVCSHVGGYFRSELTSRFVGGNVHGAVPIV